VIVNIGKGPILVPEVPNLFSTSILLRRRVRMLSMKAGASTLPIENKRQASVTQEETVVNFPLMDKIRSLLEAKHPKRPTRTKRSETIMINPMKAGCRMLLLGDELILTNAVRYGFNMCSDQYNGIIT